MLAKNPAPPARPKMEMTIPREHRVVFPVNNSGHDNIVTALALVKTVRVVLHNDNHISAQEMVDCLQDVIDLAERFLEAGAAWARDADKAMTDADYAAPEEFAAASPLKDHTGQ